MWVVGLKFEMDGAVSRSGLGQLYTLSDALLLAERYHYSRLVRTCSVPTGGAMAGDTVAVVWDSASCHNSWVLFFFSPAASTVGFQLILEVFSLDLVDSY